MVGGELAERGRERRATVGREDGEGVVVVLVGQGGQPGDEVRTGGREREHLGAPVRRVGGAAEELLVQTGAFAVPFDAGNELHFYSACVAPVALARGLGDRAVALRLPLVGALVLAGNVARNTVLVALEATGRAVASGLHEGIGLLALAAVCGAVAAWMGRQGAIDKRAAGAIPVRAEA